MEAAQIFGINLATLVVLDFKEKSQKRRSKGWPQAKLLSEAGASVLKAYSYIHAFGDAKDRVHARAAMADSVFGADRWLWANDGAVATNLDESAAIIFDENWVKLASISEIEAGFEGVGCNPSCLYA